MATVRQRCPHCSQMERLTISTPLETRNDTARRTWLAGVRFGEYDFDAVSGMRCAHCGGWSIGVFNTNSVEGLNLLKSGPGHSSAVEDNSYVQLLAVYP